VERERDLQLSWRVLRVKIKLDILFSYHLVLRCLIILALHLHNIGILLLLSSREKSLEVNAHFRCSRAAILEASSHGEISLIRLSALQRETCWTDVLLQCQDRRVDGLQRLDGTPTGCTLTKIWSDTQNDCKQKTLLSLPEVPAESESEEDTRTGEKRPGDKRKEDRRKEDRRKEKRGQEKRGSCCKHHSCCFTNVLVMTSWR